MRNLNRSLIAVLSGAAMLLASPYSFADYGCTGTVGYLGISSDGRVTVALTNVTPVHLICSIEQQGTFTMSVPSCKATYAAFLAARLAGKTMVVYYHETGLTCATLPSWGAVPSVYFVEGPN
ncbi:MAG: hypothetical protein ABIV04_16800 [Massilia sp.]